MRIAERVISLREFARKLQIELVRIQGRWHKRLLWESVEIQFSQICCAGAAVRMQLIESDERRISAFLLRLVPWHSHTSCAFICM